jgi:guanylate kinase
MDSGARRGGDVLARGIARSARGSVFVVSAPSGAGKTTLCRRLFEELQGIVFSVSYTTRKPRAGEQEGVDYQFTDRADFERRRKKGELVEWAMVDGQMYGTSAAQVKQATAAGQDILLDIDTQGAENVRHLIPDAVLIFVLPPSREALRERLEGRGTENPEALARRMSLARGEIQKASMYDYIVINDELDAAYQQLRAIVIGTRCRRERQMGRVKEITAAFAPGR